MTKIYACLIGNWVCLNDDPKCKMGPNQVSPLVWWEENAYLYAPLTRRSPDTLYEFPYLNILYMGTDYRISPYHVQIVSPQVQGNHN